MANPPKIEEQPRVQFSNFPQLDEVDAGILQHTLSSFFARVAKQSYSPAHLSLHFKEYGKQGERAKHSINARFTAGKISLEAQNWDWNLLSAVQKTLKALEKEFRKARDKKKSTHKKHQPGKGKK